MHRNAGGHYPEVVLSKEEYEFLSINLGGCNILGIAQNG